MQEKDPIIEKLQEEADKNEKLTENKMRDETGANRDALFHRELSEIIDNSITFDSNGTAVLKNDAENIFWEAITARDLLRINQITGHWGGDDYLKSTVEYATAQAVSTQIENPRLYHIQGADFILSGLAPAIEIGALESVLDTYSKTFNSQGKPAHLSSVSLTLSEVMDFYNEALPFLKNREYAQETEQINFKKLLIGQIHSLLAFRQEYQKLLDTYLDLNVIYNDRSRDRHSETENDFNTYAGHMFRGYGIEKFADFSGIENISDLFFKIAYERSFYQEDTPMKAWSSLSSMVFEHAQAPKQLQEFWIKKEAELVKYGIQQESLSEVTQRFAREKHFFQTMNGVLIESLGTNIKALPEEVTERTDYLTLQKYLLTSSSLMKIYKDNPTAIYIHKTVQDEIEQIQKFHEKNKNDVENSDQGEQSKNNAENVIGDIQIHLDRLNKFREYAVSAYEQIQIYMDRLTGLPNKQAFNERMSAWQEQHAENGNFGLVSIDMGFLKYFNYIGTRETGDLAIMKTAVILERVREAAKLKNIEIEVYRTGGDEFEILVAGDQNYLLQIIELIEEKNHEIDNYSQQPTGLIPKHPHAKITYSPEILQFDCGTAHITDAKEILKTLVHGNPEDTPFSKEELQYFSGILDEDIDNPEQMQNYHHVLAEIQVRLADRIISGNKQALRFELLFGRFTELSNNRQIGKLPEDFTGRIPQEPAYYKWQQFNDLVSFSGKTMGGKTLVNFNKTYTYALENGMDTSDLTKEQLDRLQAYFYTQSGAQEQSDELGKIVSKFRKI